MNSFDAGRKNETNYPDDNSIMIVTQECNCDRQRAIHLLSLSNNDPEEAIKFYNMRSKYFGKLPQRPSPTTSTPITPRSEATPSPALNGEPGLNDSLRLNLNPKAWMRRASAQSLESSEDGHDGNVQSSEPHIAAPHSPLLPSLPRNVSKGEPNWDFVLPVIPLTNTNLGLSSAQDYEDFNLRNLVGEMQNGASVQTVHKYLERFDRAKVREHINENIDGFPAMFYVVETNKEEMLRTWVAFGGNPTAIHKESTIPLLTFAIMHSENIQTDTTPMTATLLSLGAAPNVIPSAFYSPYFQDVPETGPSDDSLKDQCDENKQWCKGAVKARLARTTTLSQRYYLERAAKAKKPSIRQTQVAQKRNAEPLLGIANFLIGQNVAAKTLLDKLLSHLTVPSKKPLVLVFAGPSGHGKTELARRLGSLLSLELEVVDCTIFNRESELFGPRQPYVGWDKGSRLNNFLVSNHQKRSIVFLDEFEKTNADIHKTLLLPFDNGEYQDRRSQDKINCSQTIWILATNAHDQIIQDFSAANNGVLFVDDDESEKEGLLKKLSKQIKQDFLAHHGSPITGRISAFIPFLPFSKGEQAVIIHKHLLELGRHIRSPINLTKGDREQLVGNVRLRIRRDASVCRNLAQSEYHTDLGARSLISAVDTIKTLMVEAYLAVDEEISEKAGMSECIIDVNGGEVVVGFVPPKQR